MKSRYYPLLAGVIALAVVRVVLTYPVFCETFDEPVHIGAGMEWLDRGTYVTDLEHPPLARVLSALGPFVTGVRATITSNFVVNGRVSRNPALVVP